MEEIEKLHQLDLEWGCITNLLNKISDVEDKIDGGWPELVNMLADAMVEEGQKKDPASAFFNLYGFMWRMYYRLKENPTRRPFNRYTYDEKNRWFMIYNYDYNVYRWAIEKGLGEGISGGYITISEDKLTTKQVAAMKARTERNK